jgi:UDP-N-acetylglucosamine 4,6-dehydratase
MFSNQIIFISGGTGSWGQELVKQLLNKYENIKEIRIYSRGEHRQVEMKRQFGFNPKIRFIIGDIRDKSILSYAMKGADIVFHLAALKHVPVCEENTWEAVLTNINGTQNVIESAIFNGVKKVVDVSTDKAVDPFNLYGVTKACGEKLMINANYNYSPNGAKSETAFICIRGGNVLGTNGSIIPLFKKQLLESNEVTVTDPSMTRFLMSAPEAISLIFIAVEKSIGGELFVMKMPAATVAAVSKVMIKLFGNSDSKVKIIGPRPGEKKHEVLVSKNEAQFTRIFSDSHYIIFPQIYDEGLVRTYDGSQSLDFDEFTSENARLLNDDELEAMIVNEAWLMG